MKFDTAGLQAFVAVVEHGSFSKAATALFITQAGLSRRLKNLETQLGVVLIERTTRTWRLSQVGHGFLPRAQRLLSDINNAFHEVRDTSRLDQAEVGIACVSSVASHLLPRIVSHYTQRFPRNRLRLFDAAAHEVTDAVLSKRADIGITVLPAPLRGIEAAPLLHDPFVLVCRDDHKLKSKKEVRWRELRNESLILLSHGTGSGLYFDRAVAELNIVLPRTYEVLHPTSALGLVNEGLGAAILPNLILFRDAYPRIRAVPLVGPVVRRQIALIHPQDVTLTVAARGLATIVKEVFAAWTRSSRQARRH